MPISSWSKAEKEAFRTQHPTKYPVEQVNHNFPKADVKTFANLVYAADHPEYKGLVTIVRRPKRTTTMEIVASVPAEQVGEWLARMHVSTDADYYLTKAQFKAAQTWNSGELFALNAIWVDVDAHGEIPSFVEMERIRSLLIHALPELAGIPIPNLIVYSGRGFHLVWLIEQCAAELAFMHRAVSHYYGEAIQNLLVGLKFTKCYSVDTGYALLNSHNQRAAWEQQYQTAAELFAEGNYRKAVELVEDVPKNIAEQPALLTVAKAGVLLNANTEEALRDGLDLLKYAWDLGSYSEQGAALQAELTARLQETLYEKAVSLLHKGDAYAARDYLKELGDYKDAATILVYTHALIDFRWCDVTLYRWALESLQAIPPDYNGEFAEEIAALRDALPGKIAEQEQIDAERAANLAQQQQQQKPKPPQTFNYGGSSTDTGPGSGYSLREDYSDPEDLYEDGDYDDLDKAWDEWEEGW